MDDRLLLCEAIVMMDQSYSENVVGQGNFQALLQFCIDADNEVLKHHLETADRNAMYTSKEVQNEISGDIIRNKILKKI